MNKNSKVLSFIAVVLGLVILGSEVWERRANSSESLLNSTNPPQINITPDEKPTKPEVQDEEAIPDETPEVKPEPINPQQPKRRFIIPRGRSGSGLSGGGCSPGGGCPGGAGEIYYEDSYQYQGCTPYYQGYSYGRCR